MLLTCAGLGLRAGSDRDCPAGRPGLAGSCCHAHKHALSLCPRPHFQPRPPLPPLTSLLSSFLPAPPQSQDMIMRMMARNSVSESLQKKIDAAVKKIATDAYDQALRHIQ